MLAYGGGSVSDCCKIVSAQAKLDEDIWEMQYEKHKYPKEFIPMGTIVTVFGTGSEMNAGAVITHDDFQAHQIEHQLGAYTDCNHGAGLAVIHPVLYKHIYKEGLSRFARFAENVWGIEDHDMDSMRNARLAEAGIEALKNFIIEIGLPTTFKELGIPEDTDFRAIADSTNVTAGCCKKLTADEIYEILLECR